ncbi:hypothetical protein [Sphingomonas sp. SRS2]|uniref:hypothetical protein n=1 Tax=Sphingomonas sp. SRS2 TaxID=133190 RepID=UPI0006183FA3|nr:hypothetical protein [Sphingomonas sp. SRS2]KKC24648.1 hypothetical protein WP12_18300 [Sphingomonas sp. SRS2]
MKRSIMDMTDGEVTRVRAWVAAFRDSRIDGHGLKLRLVENGYAEREAERFADLIVSTSS